MVNTSLPISAGTGSLRARQKASRRASMISTALRLFDQEGFENVTMEQIADQIGMSSRTIRRYFATKEDLALAVGLDLDQALARHMQLGSERPLLEAIGQAMTASIEEALQEHTEDELLAVFGLMEEVDSVRARALLYSSREQRAVAEAVIARPDVGPERAHEAELLVAVVAAANHLALSRWRANPKSRTLLEEVHGTLKLLPEVVSKATAR
ncbi:TetR/AcrR family transcriptional regulator [Streptomyces sp. NPDC002870]|uniref:TetR/AcrR family transcriptional regulator n=1 Tax=Streptomyces sp. NPDC002870 TaxID=3364666 RepID=UPI0036744840